jgi:5,5'-dehydrodivanillate O-demethylase oxygenase subunit
MLSEEENRELMQTGPGTLMGELLRRYWMPIAAVAELDDNPIKPVRLMCEDLVLYKDKSGTYGLLDTHCPHRRADLSYGIIEEEGLRCNYHGWLFNEGGRCLEQPFEEIARPEANFKDRVTIKSYAVEAKGGILWAYLGPKPAPLVPDYDFLSEPGYKQIVYAEIPCNWFQCQENSIDPVHFEWLHSNWSASKRGGGRAPTHLRLGFDEFEWGHIYRRIRQDTDEDNTLWTVGRVCLWPNALFSGFPEWRVPIDDTHTFSLAYFNVVPPGDEPFYQERVPYWTADVVDPKTGRWIDSHVMNQDFIAWVGQGALADRTLERLGESDRGIIMMRKKMMEQARLVADGGEPKAVIRDPERNRKLPIRSADRNLTATGRVETGARELEGLLQAGGDGDGDGFGGRDGKAPRNRHLHGQPQWILDEMDALWAQRTRGTAG